jgi:acetyl-CoA C-acetyltransferase
LKLLDCSPITDGASAVVLAATGGHVSIVASSVATDTIGLSQRQDLTMLQSTVDAAKHAYVSSGLGPKDIHVAEVHDCFTIAEILAMENLGFFPRGKAATAIERNVTRLGGAGPIVNTSGGLKASGHPVGATGVKQVVEVTRQLQGRGGKKQVVGATVGLTHNVGGSGGTAVVHILRKKKGN